jgi:hypothetical protein
MDRWIGLMDGEELYYCRVMGEPTTKQPKEGIKQPKKATNQSKSIKQFWLVGGATQPG